MWPYSSLVLLISALALRFGEVDSCASSGVCSGGCCAPPCPPPVTTCNPSSCQQGYSCGHYGCARNRARSSLTRKDGIIVPVDDFIASNLSSSAVPIRNIFGVERKKYLAASDVLATDRNDKIDHQTYAKLTNPNYLFRQCCEDRHLPDACLGKCHFNTFTKQALQDMFFKIDPCPIEAAADLQKRVPGTILLGSIPSRRNPSTGTFKFPHSDSPSHPAHFAELGKCGPSAKDSFEMESFPEGLCLAPVEDCLFFQYCAAQGRDHVACCTSNSIHTTLAGEKCLTFCDQRAGRVTRLDYSYLPCYDRFENMKRCFFTEIKFRMEAKLKPRLDGSALHA